MKVKSSIMEAIKLLDSLKINSGTSGNISVRVAKGFMITPSGISALEMTMDDLVVVDMNGEFYGQQAPSSEWHMHRDIYLNYGEANAVVHAHPPYATALSCQRKGIPAFHYMIAVSGSDQIPCANYATFGTPELSRLAIESLHFSKICLLANHGLLCYGKSLQHAIDLCQEAELLARQYLLSMSAGEPVVLDQSEMQRVIQKFETYGARH